MPVCPLHQLDHERHGYPPVADVDRLACLDPDPDGRLENASGAQGDAQDPNARAAELMALARNVMDELAAYVEADPLIYEGETDVLFSLAVEAVRRYAEALDEPVDFVLQALRENLV